MYFFRKKDPNRPKSFNLKVMHIVNYVVIIIFILGLLYKLIQYASASQSQNTVKKNMKEIINTPNAPAPIGPYNQAIKAGNTLFVSGQIAISPQTNDLVNGSVEEETRQVMQNIGAILEASGFSFADVVKSSIFLSDMESFGKVNAVYGEYFVQDAPARETIAVKGLPKNVNVEISVIAYKE